MKIIHVVPYIKNLSAGTTYAVVSLCEALTEAGCEITLFTLNPVPEGDHGFRIRSFKPSKFPHPALGRSKPMYEALLDESKGYDLIHSHMLWMAPSYYAGFAAKFANIPYVCSPHGSLSKWVLKRSRWKKILSLLLGQRLALNRCDCFHITAPHEKEEIVTASYFNNRLICDSNDKRYALIPNGISITDLKVKDSKEVRNVLFMSRLHPKKGLELLIGAWSNLHEKYPETRLQIVGPVDDPVYVEKLKRQIAREKINRVDWLGELHGHEKADLLANADLFVFPTYSENFGLVVGEALASGIPVISTKGAPWEGLVGNDAGWWVEIGVEPIQNAISEALDLSTQKLSEKGENGRRWMMNDYSWEKIALDFVDLYKKLKK